MGFLFAVALHAGVIGYPGLDLLNLHFMWGMTRGTGRNTCWIALPEFTPDHFRMGLLNLDVTFHTGSGDPAWCHS
jgi:hypothetical protein